jgi:probable rRNA maturation factor
MNDTELFIDVCSENEETDIDEGRLIEIARHVCTRFDMIAGAVDIAIVGDEGIVKINEEFLQRTTKTDVISFDLSDDNQSGRNFEIVINADRAKRQAKSRDHSFAAELALYVVHGLLHNLGFDDCDEAQAKKMHSTEDEILNELGFGAVYYAD